MKSVEKNKVYIVDDHQLLVRGLQAILESDNSFEFSGSASNIEDALASISKLPPNLVLVDIIFQDKPDGFEFIKILRRDYPEIIPVVITAYDNISYIKQAFDVGAVGYVTKDEPHDVMLHAFKQALAGRKYLRAELAEKIMHESALLVDTLEIERKNHSERLAENKRFSEFAKLALQQVREAVYLADETGRLCYVNHEAVRTLGYSEEELLAMKVEDVSPDMVPGSWSKLWNDIKQEKSITIKKNHRNKNGHVFPVEINTNFFEFDGQEFVLGLSRDISLKKKDEELILKSEKQFRSLAENSPDFIARFDKECRILYSSPRILSLISKSLDTVLGKKPTELSPGGKLAQITEEMVQEAISSGQTVGKEIPVGNDFNGNPLWHFSRFIPEFDINGELESVLQISTDISAKKATEDAHREREKRYREIFENSQDSIFLLEVLPGGHFRNLEINPAFEKSTGIPKELLIGKTIEETSPPDVAEAVNAKYRRCIELGKIYEETLELDLPLGHRTFHSTIIPVRDETGKVYRLTGITKDITEMKESQEQVKLLGFALDLVKEAAFLMDDKGNIQYVNHEACISLGYTRDELLKMKTEDFDPAWPHERQDEYWEALKIQKSMTLESFHQRKTGEQFPVEITANYFEFDGREYNLALVRDISERKKNEEAIILREREFRTLADNMPDNIIRYDLDCRAVYLNATMQKTLGKNVDLVLGKTPLERNPPVLKDTQQYQNVLKRVIDSGSSEDLVMEAFGRVSGEFWLTQISFVAERDDQGNIIGALAIGRDITELIEVTKKIQESESRFRGTLEAAQIGLWDWDVKNDKWYGTATYYSMLGYEPKNGPANRNEWLKLVHPKDRKIVRDKLEKVLSGESEVHEYETRWLHKNGSYRWQLNKGFGMERDADGKVIRMLGIKMDIHERKLIEESLVLREREFRTLAENIPDNIIRFDKSGRGFFANHAMKKNAKPGDAEWYTKKPVEQNALIVKNPEHFEQTLVSVLGTGKSAEIEVEVINDPLRVQTHQVRFFPEFDNNGEISGVLSIGRDITERIRTEQLLRESERNLRALAENIPDYIIQYNLDCRAIYINPSMKTRLREIEGSFIGGMPMDRNPPVMKDPQAYQESVQRVISTSILEELEIEIFNHTGGTNIVLCRIAPVFDDNDQITGALTIGHDITEQKRIEQILIDREQEFHSLARKLVHQENRTSGLPDLDILTGREKRVFLLTGQGKSYIEIARELDISENTVNSFKNKIKEKLQIRNSTELLHVAMQYVMSNPEQ